MGILNALIVSLIVLLLFIIWLQSPTSDAPMLAADHHDRKMPARGMYWQFKDRLESDKLRQERLRKRHNRAVRMFKKPDGPIVILIWDGMQPWWLVDFSKDQASLQSIPIVITYDQEMLPEAHIVIFNNAVRMDVVQKMEAWQARSLLTLEPILGYPQIYPTLEHVDILISYSGYSEVQVDYTYEMHLDSPSNSDLTLPLNRRVRKEKRRDALACFFISNCENYDSPFRLSYLKKLMEFIPIHSHGYCLHTEGLKGFGDDKIVTQSVYKFALAFENTILDDYVTEKFYQAIMSDTIPVYLGAPNILEYLPNKTAKVIINVLDYPDPADLASYLIHLANNDQEYSKYFEWRRYPLESTFTGKHGYFQTGTHGFPLRAAKWYLDHSTDESRYLEHLVK